MNSGVSGGWAGDTVTKFTNASNAKLGRQAPPVGAGANVLSFGRFQNADGFAAAISRR